MSVTGNVTTYTGNGSTNAGGTSTSNGSTIDQASFMNLLVKQLQYQDPLNPESNTDFAAQMAQFSSLQQMQNLNTTLTSESGLQQMSSAAALIGHTVDTNLVDSSGAAITGVVTSVGVGADGSLTAQVGTTAVPLGNITSIQNSDTSTGSSSAAASTSGTLSSTNTGTKTLR